MSRYRAPTAYVLGVLVLLAIIVLTTPNGGTHARRSTTGQAAAPARVQTVPDPGARAIRLTAQDPPGTEHRSGQDSEGLARAVSAAGDTPHADSACAWKLRTPGNSGTVIRAGLPS